MTSDGSHPRTVHDPRILRAIAHPARNRILSELSATGVMRAADVARELGIPANQASFHLRQLAKYGLVEEAPGEARDKRDRVWRLVDEDGLRVDVASLEETPGGKAAVRVFLRSRAGSAHAAVDRAFGSERVPDTFQSVTEQSLRLTKQEAGELAEELEAVLADWSRRTRGRDEARRTYLVLQLLQPHPDETGPPPLER